MERTILVVEDEKAIADIIVFNLQREGFQTLDAQDGPTGLSLALSKNPDLILLDVMLPGMDGFEICKKVREKSEVPIIMLTAREEETDKIFGLELGADDYITKPFSMRELIARIKANMRRSAQEPAPSKNSGNKRRRFGDIELDLDRREIRLNGEIVDLTMREYELLSFLAQTPGKIYSREELMQKVWNYDFYGDLRAVDVCVRRLREKIEKMPSEPRYIMTKRGLGYYFNAET